MHCSEDSAPALTSQSDLSSSFRRCATFFVQPAWVLTNRVSEPKPVSVLFHCSGQEKAWRRRLASNHDCT